LENSTDSGVDVSGDLADIINLEAALLTLLQKNLTGGSFTAPSGASEALQVLFYLDLIAEVFHASVFKGTSVYPNPDETEISKMKTAHHYACLGYADYILQGVFKWTKKTGKLTHPTSSGSEYYCFTDYVKAINGLVT
jgi:hypothetical protein